MSEFKNTKNFIKTISIIALVFFILISVYVSIHIIRFIESPEKFQSYIESFGILGPVIYVFFVVLQIFFPIIPGEPTELVGGYCFGFLKGTLLCLLAQSLGSIIVLLFARKYGTKLVEIFFEKERIEKLHNLLSSKKNLRILTTLFIIPGTPKDLLCYFAGLIKVDIKILFVITSLARIPSVVTSTIIGGTLSNQNYMLAIITFAITTIISIFGIVTFNKKLNKKQQI